MATPAEKLAVSLDMLRKLQETGLVAIKASMISRTHRERLLDNGFIREVFKGWYMMSPPDAQQGDSTSWYQSYWPFCAQFLKDKYKNNWCISPEQSLLLHAGNWTVPEQLIIRSPKATNFKTGLPYHTSLFQFKSPIPLTRDVMESQGIRMFNLPACLINISPNTFTQNSTDVRTAISMITDASEILNLLLPGGHSIIAGRIAGAFRNIRKDRIADDILKTMQKAGYDVRETNPFINELEIKLSNHEKSPYGNRLRLMWHEMREIVIRFFPPAPGLPPNQEKYLQQVEKVYVTDAYHSLSIEQYKVTPELIERVRSGIWNHRENEADLKQRDAMAAKGYWEAFKAVESSIKLVMGGENAGKVLDHDHGEWYRQLFGPSVNAGLLNPADLAGYRNHQVYISQSKHVPLNKEAVRDAMPVLFELLQEETEASVKAVLGHYIFVYIHPYIDGNGRMGRFVMNLMLASGGYPWTVIPIEERKTYMQALERASVYQDIKPFTQFLGYLVKEGLKGTPVAKI
jgi:hypothetical protein